MIFIFSRCNEPSGYRLERRLTAFGVSCKLLFEEDVYLHRGTLVEISPLGNRVFGIPVDTIKGVFFRKWNSQAIANRLDLTPENALGLSEYQFVFDFIGLLPNVRKLGFYNMAMHNKLYQQFVAQQLGLPILQNIVCNNEIPALAGRWVSKPFNRSFFDDNTYGNHTTVVLPEQLPKNVGLAYLQPLVKKQFEIRTMYLEGRYYAIAYYTAKNNDPDRRYQTGLRTVVPFKLPAHIEHKITQLMHRLGGNYALIDLIYDEGTDAFYFLEANPFGQYGDLIKYGGYDIDGAIINYLVQENADEKVQSKITQSGTYPNSEAPHITINDKALKPN